MYRLNTNSKGTQTVTDITMACDHIDFKTYAVIQVTHNHDNNPCVFWKVKKICTSMACDCIDLRYIHKALIEKSQQ